MNRHLYVPCAANPDILRNAIASIIDQVDAITVINNTREFIEGLDDPKISVLEPPDMLLYGQSLNYAVRQTYRDGEKACLWAHNDILVKPGAVDALYEKYEELKDTKWGVIWTNYDSLCLFNPVFFVEEGLWDDVYLLPTYFGDNLRAHLMKLRGYSMNYAEKAFSLVNHLGSQTIVQNHPFRRKNDIVFSHHGNIYSALCGGPPGQERNTDPTLGGIYPLRSV